MQRKRFNCTGPAGGCRFRSRSISAEEMSVVNQLDMIRERIAGLYAASPRIHVNVKLPRLRLDLTNDPVEIKGVYRNIFTIEECRTGVPRIHALQYADVLTGSIEILEDP